MGPTSLFLGNHKKDRPIIDAVGKAEAQLSRVLTLMSRVAWGNLPPTPSQNCK
jgi:hypothetical protein